jgi:hypothetical protein
MSPRKMISLFRSRDGQIYLPPTTESGKVNDPLDELNVTKAHCSRRRTRHLIIAGSVTAILLVMLIYLWDVERSWLALEDKWMVSSP